MVSRRNYIAIVTMFLILFFMFQFTGVMKERLNEYGINEYEELTKTGFGEKDAWGGSAAGQGGISDGRPYVVYAGDLSEAPGSVVRWWCIYTKRELAVCESIAECKIAEEAPPEVLVADGSLVRGEEDVRARRLDTTVSPREVFRADGLRLLRLCRFAAELGFAPTEETVAGAREFRKEISIFNAHIIMCVL